jgi:inhibitor of KinA
MIAAIESLGDTTILVRFGEVISRELNERVLALADDLDRHPIEAQRDVVPAFSSLAVIYDPLIRSHSEIEEELRTRVAGLTGTLERSPRQHEIPVCYDPEVAPDLVHVAEHAGLAVDEVIAIHSAAVYRVYMIGFTPGFPYLGGLDPRLEMPRRSTPRVHVPAGSVAIGGAQTGIYPDTSPGGWWIIGCTPTPLFDPMNTPPSTLAPGDLVRFRPITLADLVQ